MWSSYNTIAILISTFSLLISLFVAFNSYYRSKAKIVISQMKNSQSWILQSYDGSYAAMCKQSTEVNTSVAPKMSSIAFLEIIITNQSTLPISILEFEVEGTREFNSYSHLQRNVKVTPDYGSQILIDSEEDRIPYLQPEFTLSPYTSKRGYVLLWMEDEKSIEPGIHTLKIVTSRKTFKSKVEIWNEHESAEKYSYRR